MESKLSLNILVLFVFQVLFLAAGSGCSVQTSPKLSPTPTNGYSYLGEGVAARVLLTDVKGLAREEKITLLMNQWLDGFKNNTGGRDAIQEYKIDKIIIRNHPADADSEVIASVLFAVQPVGYSSNWASLSGQAITEADPWWHEGVTFDFLQDGEYLIMKPLFGYGT